MSDLSYTDKLKRLHKVKELVDEEKTDTEIASALGMSLRAVQRNRSYLKDLAIADLTNKEIAQKREELYLELLEATEEVKVMFDFYKVPRKCPICNGTGLLETDEAESKNKACSLCHGKMVIHFPKDAKRFFDAWIEAIEMRAKLYGLDTMKVDSLIQLNQFNQYQSPDKVDSVSGNALAKLLKEQHEKKLKKIN